MTGTNCDLFTHNQSQSYLNHLVSSLSLSLSGKLAAVAQNNYMERDFKTLSLISQFHNRVYTKIDF
jgi:hypothetical protein